MIPATEKAARKSRLRQNHRADNVALRSRLICERREMLILRRFFPARRRIDSKHGSKSGREFARRSWARAYIDNCGRLKRTQASTPLVAQRTQTSDHLA